MASSITKPILTHISDLKSILSLDVKYCFFDLEDTMLGPNYFFTSLGLEEFKQKLFALCEEHNVKFSDVVYLGKNYKRQLLQEDAGEVIQTLKNSKKKVFALTSGYPSKQKRDQLVEMGVCFHGYLFTKGAEKGPFLTNFFETNNFSGGMLFVDNHDYKLESVWNAFIRKKIDCPVNLFLYTKSLPNTVTMEAFVEYWLKVIKSLKQGMLEELKQNNYYKHTKNYLNKNMMHKKKTPINNKPS